MCAFRCGRIHIAGFRAAALQAIAQAGASKRAAGRGARRTHERNGHAGGFEGIGAVVQRKDPVDEPVSGRHRRDTAARVPDHGPRARRDRGFRSIVPAIAGAISPGRTAANPALEGYFADLPAINRTPYLIGGGFVGAFVSALLAGRSEAALSHLEPLARFAGAFMVAQAFAQDAKRAAAKTHEAG